MDDAIRVLTIENANKFLNLKYKSVMGGVGTGVGGNTQRVTSMGSVTIFP